MTNEEQIKKWKKQLEEYDKKRVAELSEIRSTPSVPISSRNKDADTSNFFGGLLGGLLPGAGIADVAIKNIRADKTLQQEAKKQGIDLNNLYTTQENLNMFGADVGRTVEATGAGISSSLANLGKGILIGARNMGALSSAVDKAITDLRTGTENAQIEELKLKAKEKGIDTVTLDEYLEKAKNTKTSLENIEDFSENIGLNQAQKDAQQRIVELQNETENEFAKKAIGFMPNLSQQVVTMGASLINPVLGTTVATGQAMGSYYDDAKARGMTLEQANDYSQIMGIVEGATEMIGVDKLIKAGKGAKALAKGGLSSAKKELSKEVITSTFGNLLGGAMDNFMQEALTEPIQEGFADWIGGKGNWENIDQRMLEAGINGAISSLIMGGANIGVQSAVGTASKLRNGQTVTQQELNQDLVDTLAEIDKFSPEEKQEFIDKYVKPGIETAQEVTKQGLDQAQNEPKSTVPMQTSENAQQQVQEQEQQVIPNQNENALNQNVEPQNLVESAKRSGIDVKDEKTRKNLEVIQKFNENRGIKATFDADAFKGHDNVNSFFRVDENGNREIVFNPNTMTDKTIQQLAVHEIYHDMVAGGTAQELTDFVVQKMSSNPEYQEYVRALQDVYEEQDSDIIKEEAVAHYLEKNLGTDEFISELQQRGDRTTIQRIIDTIKDMITKAKNTLTGKGDLNYLLDLQRKYEQAYRGEFKGTQEQTKLSKQVNENKIQKADATKVENQLIDRLANKLLGQKENITKEDISATARRQATREFIDLELETDADYDKFKNRVSELENKLKEKLQISDQPNIDYESPRNLTGEIFSKYQIDSVVRDIGVERYRNFTKQHNSDFDDTTNPTTRYATINGELSSDYYNIDGNLVKLTTTKQGDNLYIDELYVEKQKQGTGTKVVKMLQDYAKKSGLSLKTMKELESAKGFWDKVLNRQQPTTDNADIRYSKEAPTKDNQGRELSNGQQEYFKNSVARDKDGNLKTLYHGTTADFSVFNYDNLGKNGTANGKGFYLADDKNVAKAFSDGSDKIKTVYANIEKPLKIGETTMSADEYTKFAEAINDKTNGLLFTDRGDGEPIQKNSKQYQEILDDLKQDYKYGGDDVDLVNSILNGANISLEDGYRVLKDTIGYDGIIAKSSYNDDNGNKKTYTQYIPLTPEQIKNVDNTNPTTNPDIRLDTQGTGTSQQIINNFLENTKVNEGTGTAIKDLARVPVPKTDYKALLQPQLDRLSASDKAQMSEIIDNLDAQGQLNEEAYNSALETINALQEVAQETTPTDELSVKLKDGKYGKFDSELSDYRNRYNKGQLDYNKNIVNDAMELVPGKKIQGQQKRTKAEWLRIAQHIGQDIANLSDQEIKNIAYGSWENLSPNISDHLNRQGQKYEAFKSYEWNNAIYDAVKRNRTEITETEQTRQVAPDSQVTTQDYLTHHPDYYDGDQFDFNAHRTEVINKANQDIVDIIKNSSNLREDLQRAYDLNEKNDVEDIKTGQDEDNRLTYQHKETILSSLLRSKDIENSDLYKLLMEDNTPRQVAPDQAPTQVPQQDVAKERVVEPIKDITDVERPQIPQGNKVRKTYESIINSNQMTQEAKQIARELMGYDTYEPQTNKLTLAVADKNIEQNGVNESLTTLTNKVNNNDKISAVDIAMGERLIQYYSKTGDRAKLQEAIQTTAMAGTEAGRAVQAMAMLNHQTPTGQVTWIQRSIDKVNKRLAKEGKPQFNFTPEMQQKILNSTQENLQKNLDSVYRELGQQVPKSAMEKFNEWRYFSMLANPKTHIRNILGNVVMGYVQRAKNKVAGTIEDFVIGDNAERWNSLKGASKGMYEFAKNDLKNADVQSMLGLNENKYNPQSRLQQNQRTFKNKFLEGTLGKLFDLNSKALEVEDGWGLKSGYAKAMANYLNANNLDYTNLTDTQLQKARQYAVQQAKEATFHQDNSIANMLQTIENKNLFTKIAVGGAIPFKKTPMNVALTGFEYSPAGFVKTLTTDLSNLKKGKISANQFIDNISKNLTGTGIAVVGYALTQAGILKASGSGDEDKDEFEEATGKQNYSIQIGDNTYSLDWLTPAGIPLFIGSELYQVSHKQEDGNKTKNENESLKAVSNILDATASAMNPMSEMTMISSLTSALKSYASGNTKSIENMIANVGKSYVTQAVPTALGQIARSTDEYERSTTSTETDPMTKAIDSAKNQIVSKIPILRETLPVSTDVWGNERKTQDLVSNAVLPWTKKEILQDPVNKALTDLYDATGEGGVLPDNYIDKTLTIDKEKYKLTNEEYAELKQQYGKTSHDILSNLTNTSNYNKMTDEQKVKAVKEAYSYAKSTLKVKYSQDNDLDAEESATYKKVQSVINNGGDAREYFEYVGLTSGLDKDKEKMKALQNSSIKNKGAIYESTIGKNDETYQIMKNAGINASAYLDYKQQEFKTDKENDYSAKNQFYDYMDDANMTYEQKLLLTGMKYKLNPGERDTLADYIESLPISAQKKTDMFKKLKGCKITEYGEIYY